MDPDELKNKLENLKTPEIEPRPPEELKMTILNAKRSATLGVWFVLIPLYFLGGVLMKYIFHVNLGLIDATEELMASLDRSMALKWVAPLLLMGLPLAAVALNILAIVHFGFDRERRLFSVTVKLRWLNIVILAVSAGIIGIFLLYLITENCNHL